MPQQSEMMQQYYGLSPEVYIGVINLLDERLKEVYSVRRGHEELKDGQERLESRMDRVEATLERLAEAQERTEKRVEELAQAQARTEERVEKLFEAQERTDKMMEQFKVRQDKLIDDLGLVNTLPIKSLYSEQENYTEPHKGDTETHREEDKLSRSPCISVPPLCNSVSCLVLALPG